ncbi:MAG TPA: hypothetical protein VL147_18480 [Devosia sp.]|nr:hypothetical protein [Devosia sp.]
MTDSSSDTGLGRASMTNTKRIELLERDRAQQSRVLTALVDASKSFTPEQMAQLRSIMTDVLADAGLRVEEPDQQDEARRDFMFLRAFRRAVNGIAGKIGWVVIAAGCGAVIWLVNLGLNTWKGL